MFKIEELPDLSPNNNENSIGPVHGTGLQGGSHTYVSGQLEYIGLYGAVISI